MPRSLTKGTEMNKTFAVIIVAFSSTAALSGKPFERSGDIAPQSATAEQQPSPPQVGPAILPEQIVPTRRTTPIHVTAGSSMRLNPMSSDSQPIHRLSLESTQ